MDSELIQNAAGFYIDSPKIPEGRGNFYTNIPGEIDDICRIKLTGNGYKLLTLYISINKTDGSFKPTEVWIYNKSGLYGGSYYRAKKELEKLNYITCGVNKKGERTITLNYSVIYADYDKEVQNRQVPDYFSKHKTKVIKELNQESKKDKEKNNKNNPNDIFKDIYDSDYNPLEDEDFEF